MSKLRFIHPFLFALYPAIFLYAQNINLYRENILLTPLILSLAFASLVFLACLLVTRKAEISLTIASFIISVFFSYGRMGEIIKSLQLNLGNVYIGPDKILFVFIPLILCLFIFLMVKQKLKLKKINEALGVFSLILIVIVVGNTSFLEIKLGRTSLENISDKAEESLSSQGAKTTPDIYYLILDRYAGNQTLKDYRFDNSTFLNFLKSKGFYIASDSTSNYPKTFLSLGSTLNMEYLDFLTQKTKGGGTSDESFVTPMVQNNKIIQFLKGKGYSYIHVGSGWDPTRSNPNADRNFILTGGRYPFIDEFTSGFLQTTMLSPMLKKMFPDTSAVSQDPKDNDHRSRVAYEFDVFNQIPQIPGPKFVFAHILLPHDPYVFGKNCEPLAERAVSSRKNTENYLNQLQCANKKTEAVIEEILANSKSKPIIVIQADEGPMPNQNPVPFNLAWARATDATLKEKFPILNAYLLPNLKKNPLYPTITPVNSFRLIFDAYFKANLPLLPDRNIIFEDANNYYKFTDITEKLKGILNR
ncbi:MAG: hypothetical protein M1450_03920 [Patescibacteria group bacterium]|nr:hypothetical protein [Patescibacteria group bacterium]